MWELKDAEEGQRDQAAGLSWSTAQCVTLACILEATVPKPGNVHRGADFEELTYLDFLVSAVAVGEVVADAADRGVGYSVYQAVKATKCAVATNTNLGIVLLLAPLAAVPRQRNLSDGVKDVLRKLTPADSTYVYEAIRLAGSTAIGQVSEWDIRGEPPADLLVAMRAAADRDLVARQYVTDFQIVLNEALPWLLERLAAGWRLTDAVIYTYVRLLATYPDSLVVRKAGEALAGEISSRAAELLPTLAPDSPGYESALADFDFWLRSDARRRNPGTTADLVAATLFAALRDGLLQPPWR